MNTLPLDLNEFANSVLAVPPLARRPDLSLDVQQNLRLISYMEAGGLRTLLYGGNANIYHCSMRDYAQLLELLASNTQATTRVIPAVGPDFGKMMDQGHTEFLRLLHTDGDIELGKITISPFTMDLDKIGLRARSDCRMPSAIAPLVILYH